jgi:Ca2+-binding EF-hand superfamily protein
MDLEGNGAITVLQAKRILNRNGIEYSEQEIGEILNFLYTLGKIDYQYFIIRKRNEENCNTVH